MVNILRPDLHKLIETLKEVSLKDDIQKQVSFSYIVHIYHEDKSSFHLISRQISTTWILMNESINSLINYQRFWLKPQGFT